MRLRSCPQVHLHLLLFFSYSLQMLQQLFRPGTKQFHARSPDTATYRRCWRLAPAEAHHGRGTLLTGPGMKRRCTSGAWGGWCPKPARGPASSETTEVALSYLRGSWPAGCPVAPGQDNCLLTLFCRGTPCYIILLSSCCSARISLHSS